MIYTGRRCVLLSNSVGYNTKHDLSHPTKVTMNKGYKNDLSHPTKVTMNKGYKNDLSHPTKVTMNKGYKNASYFTVPTFLRWQII